MTEHVNKLADVLTGLSKVTKPVPNSDTADRLNDLTIAYGQMQAELHRQATELANLRDEVERMANKQ